MSTSRRGRTVATHHARSPACRALAVSALALAIGCAPEASAPPEGGVAATRSAPAQGAEGASSAAREAAADQKMLEAAAEGAKGENKVLARIALEETHRVREAGARYEQMATAFGAAGAFDPASMKSREDVVARIAMIDELAAENRKFQEAVSTSKANIGERMTTEGLSAETQEAFNKGSKLDQANDVSHAMRSTDARIYAAGKTLLEVLRDHHGHWTPVNGDVEFDATIPEAARTRYTQALAEMRKAGAEQEEIQRAVGVTPG